MKGLLVRLRGKISDKPREDEKRRKKTRRIAVAMLAIVLVVFVALPVYHGKKAAAARNAWIGRTRAEVQTAFGPPAETTPDGKGGTLLRYPFPCPMPYWHWHSEHYRFFLVDSQGLVYQTY